jgi:RNA polymerase sigma-70 factor (ECF subfamily)
MGDQRLLEAARRRDEGAYRELVEPWRRELHAHCYRMLGSVHDAEDALQDALLRAWRGLPRFEGRSSMRTWLYRVATNACLDVAARRPPRQLPVDRVAAAEVHSEPGRPLLESVWIEPYPDHELGLEDGFAGPEARYERRESVELAFVAAVQLLPARQRAVLLLRDVLGFSAREVAEVLETSVASANSALNRARRTLESRLPDESQQVTLRSLGDERLRRLVERFVDALERSDVDAVVAQPRGRLARGRNGVGTAAKREERDLHADSSSARAAASSSGFRGMPFWKWQKISTLPSRPRIPDRAIA